MFNSKKDEKKKDSKVGKALTEFFERDKVKYVVNVLRWILFAFILTIVWDFRHYPLTMFLFIVLGILVTPTFNDFLKKKRIEISVKKKLLLFFVIAVINLHPYFDNRQLTMTELGRQFNNFLEKNIKTSDGKVYPIPDESNDEKALITCISVYCLYLALKFDNPSLSEKDNVEFLFSNYYRMKKVVSNILNGQFTKADIEFSKTTEPIVNSKTMTDALKGIK